MVEQVLDQAPFVQHLGIHAIHLEPGVCHTGLAIRPEMLQHSGVVHAGVLTTLADHTAGAAAGTLVEAQDTLVSVEFKMHLLRAAQGERLVCKAQVVKPGRRFSVVQADVFDDGDKLVARLLGTMTTV
jgi:uncharacterized protein (TIGR00369 family)